MILGHLVRHDAALLRSTVANWPKNVYETPSIVSAVLAQLEESPGDEDLVNVVADL